MNSFESKKKKKTTKKQQQQKKTSFCAAEEITQYMYLEKLTHYQIGKSMYSFI